MPETNRFRVAAHALNLRSTPAIEEGNRIALLPQGQIVIRLGDADDGAWWEVTTKMSGHDLDGFVANEFLAPAAVTAGAVPEVHLRHPRPVVTRAARLWAYALNEEEAPRRNLAAGDPAGDLGKIIEWLDVESSARYAPKNSDTYCNIYAYDYACLAGVYLPRVWWTEKALVDLSNGEEVVPEYARTIHELNANALYDWFAEWGENFGWRRVFELDEAQEAANAGEVVMLTGRRVNGNRAGHITAIVPETDEHTAERDGDDRVTVPLQSQAGASNDAYHSRDWGQSASWADRAIWIHP